MPQCFLRICWALERSLSRVHSNPPSKCHTCPFGTTSYPNISSTTTFPGQRFSNIYQATSMHISSPFSTPITISEFRWPDPAFQLNRAVWPCPLTRYFEEQVSSNVGIIYTLLLATPQSATVTHFSGTIPSSPLMAVHHARHPFLSSFEKLLPVPETWRELIKYSVSRLVPWCVAVLAQFWLCPKKP